ncbi:MAG: hypothetical protein ABI748_08930 [Dokdonella sp.]
MAERVRDASRDALAAFRMFAGDPVGGLAGACATLGPKKSLSVGLAFGVAGAFAVALGVSLGAGGLLWLGGMSGLGGFIKISLAAVVPFASLLGVTVAIRSFSHGSGELGEAAFIAGASLLPLAVAALASGLLGIGNFEVIALLYTFALSTAFLMLFAGLTHVIQLSSRGATLALPAMVLLTAWLSKVIYAALSNL